MQSLRRRLKKYVCQYAASTVERVYIYPNPPSKYDAQGDEVINIILTKNKSLGTNYIYWRSGRRKLF